MLFKSKRNTFGCYTILGCRRKVNHVQLNESMKIDSNLWTNNSIPFAAAGNSPETNTMYVPCNGYSSKI